MSIPTESSTSTAALEGTGPPSIKAEEPRPQERLSPTDDITENPADVATTVDALPEENGDRHRPNPAAGDSEEVTYAQLDQRALTHSRTVQAAGLAMGPHPSLLLVLVLCLVQTIHMQRGLLPKPSIRAEPGPVIRRGQPVIIVCGAPDWADLFRLEEKNIRSSHWDERSKSQHGSRGKEATFHIDAMSDDTTRSYRCLYCQGTLWSERSEILELKVTAEDVITPPSGLPQLLYILVGICVACLLCLLLLLAFPLVHRKRQKKRGPPSIKAEEPRPQERLSPTDDITESPSDVATTVDALPEENGDRHRPSPVAGDPEEVTYAQLDQRALTRRAALTESPQPTEPTAESSMYAALPRH
ncbi:leukocyte-associated immunoglobulin-like receptor 1 [Phyllostomus hastatus]|uniref:leukocyte-associated immunoglobulin-like receptor 1 n=1 Tax=Phyllostomus hastatus TaxID=9423 RepID=UPI001E680D71|nr:leukocyte-associated immunoglobulin-like receptor 1 [Phyllostomus hastatus]